MTPYQLDYARAEARTRPPRRKATFLDVVYLMMAIGCYLVESIARPLMRPGRYSGDGTAVATWALGDFLTAIAIGSSVTLFVVGLGEVLQIRQKERSAGIILFGVILSGALPTLLYFFGLR